MTAVDDKAVETPTPRVIVRLTFEATKEQVSAIAETLFEETPFGVLVTMEAVDERK